ncbi:uncharacterized protein [Primulina huaijiensis]|uniref:uncharacterized protein isoform X2 n=1 Tax=Primulina huaijiensis TaxID=1492673 RepID=UPI003CC6E5AB
MVREHCLLAAKITCLAPKLLVLTLRFMSFLEWNMAMWLVFKLFNHIMDINFFGNHFFIQLLFKGPESRTTSGKGYEFSKDSSGLKQTQVFAGDILLFFLYVDSCFHLISKFYLYCKFALEFFYLYTFHDDVAVTVESKKSLVLTGQLMNFHHLRDFGMIRLDICYFFRTELIHLSVS